MLWHVDEIRWPGVRTHLHPLRRRVRVGVRGGDRRRDRCSVSRRGGGPEHSSQGRRPPLATVGAVRYRARPMEQGKVADVATVLAGLREQVRALDERVAELGRHL